MDFRLTFPFEPLADKISYRHKILLAGSCFAENMGELMKENKLNTFTNPNGIVYNPISIASQLSRCIEGREYQENELFQHNELWNSWQHHGQYSSTDKASILNLINQDFGNAKDYLISGDWLIITFGSAYVYKLKDTGEAVANCHKYPNSEFIKELLTVDEIVNTWQELIIQLKAKNPKLKIIFTVSPVRYMRDGLVNNNRSKAILLQAVHQLCDAYEHINYFPAYELVMDDLRDYRFFTQDLVHPNAQAIQYVWEKFMEAIFEDEAKTIYSKIHPLVTASKHKVLNEGTEAHQKFLVAHLKKAEKLQAEYSFLSLEDLGQSFTY